MAEGGAGTGTGDSVAAAHARLLHDKSLQLDFPTLRLAPERARPHGDPFAGLDGLGGISQVILWGGLALIAGLILFYVGRELVFAQWPSLKPKPRSLAAEPEWRPTEAQARALLQEADAMAAEGRYAEAVRLILWRSVEELQGRRPHLVRPALTSRDIASARGLPDDAREAFSGIAAAVEHSHFAGRPIDAEGFAACRRAYEDFALPGVWA